MNRRDKLLFALELLARSTLAIMLFVVTWPVVFMPWIWRGYTCWESDDAQ